MKVSITSQTNANGSTHIVARCELFNMTVVGLDVFLRTAEDEFKLAFHWQHLLTMNLLKVKSCIEASHSISFSCRQSVLRISGWP
jgi:hypothetical protein